MKTATFALALLFAMPAFAAKPACKPKDFAGHWTFYLTRTHSQSVQVCDANITKEGLVTGRCHREVEDTWREGMTGNLRMSVCQGDLDINYPAYSVDGYPFELNARVVFQLNLSHDTMLGVQTENSGDYAGFSAVKF